MTDSSQDRRVVDLVTIQMQDRQNGTISDGVQELGTMPACRKWTCLSFSVADYCQCDEVWVVEDGSEGMGDRVSKFTTLVDTARGLRRQSLLKYVL